MCSFNSISLSLDVATLMSSNHEMLEVFINKNLRIYFFQKYMSGIVLTMSIMRSFGVVRTNFMRLYL